jgi:alpha-beta hydrolase superfamily lysophospholipase
MDFGLPRYAQRFAAAGFGVLIFEYRHFGASQGEPRQLVDVGDQLTDWRAALAYTRQRPDVDPARVALWGTSLGAGHAVTVAAHDPTVAAVVAQLPFLGVEPARSSPRPAGVTLRLFAAAVRDALGGLVGRPPVMVPMVGEPGTVAVFSDTEDYAVVRTLAAEAPRWRNDMAARSLFSLIRYRPAALAGRLAMPLLVCIAQADTAASLSLAQQAAQRAPQGELRRYPGGHFTAYLGEVFENMVTDQVSFLRRHLTPTVAATGPPA